jgi:bacterioferritin-associated ferredoxin
MKSMNSHDGLVICRCESVTLGKIRECLKSSGAHTVNEVKKLTRAGMGLCQGRTCAPTVEFILEKEGCTPLGTEPYHARPPLRPVALADLAAASEDFTEPSGPVSVVMLRKPGENPVTANSSKTGESR